MNLLKRIFHRHFLIPLLCIASVGFSLHSVADVLRNPGLPEVILPKAHFLNQSEIEAGNLGRQKACRAEVRAYGEALVQDHTLNDRQALNLIDHLGMRSFSLQWTPWESRHMEQQKVTLAMLKEMRGCAFDRSFLVAMRDAHLFAIQMVRTAAAQTSSPEVKAYLLETLPQLRMHLDQAARLLQET